MSKIMTTNKGLTRRNAHLYVLGCKVNQAEIDSVSTFLEQCGFEIDHDCESPDLVFINTCCVTDSAAGKSRRLIKRLSEKYAESKMVVSGCLAEIDPAMITKVSANALVLGTHAKDHFPEILSRDIYDVSSVNSNPASSCSQFSSAWRTTRSSRSRAFLKVQDGCSHRCSYCVVPIARGPSRSMELNEAVRSAQILNEGGYSEIAVTGIHLGAYGRDLSPRIKLEDLVTRLLSDVPSCRFRLSSIEPQDFSEELLSLISHTSRICRHFHIPTQSGDDKTLKNMFRPYKTDLVLRLTAKIFESVPDACVGMDIMVGFPGETDESFKKTEEFIKKSRCNYLHVFPFSPRKGTVAQGLPNRVPKQIARSRVRILRNLSTELRSTFFSKFVDRKLEALIESIETNPAGRGKGLTDNYIPIHIRGLENGVIRKIVPVKVDKVTQREVLGTTCDKDRN
ncbi:MAG: tRNA (N(6)-L-threonylcarbamoyladenosine(37)-C(2))-methylthiotransferase MtaB [Desulfomonilaceae bacterium]